MSRTAVAHLANLKIRYGGEWTFEVVKPEHVRPPDGDGGYIARRRDDRSVMLFARSVPALEALIVGWRPGG